MPTTLEFLQAILPDRGLKCVAHLRPEGMRHSFYATHEEMADAVLRADLLGGNVYHGCASYKTHKRKAENVEALKALFFDIDADYKSGYADAAEAAEAVVRFTDRMVLDRLPLMVGSGRGVHCYYPLADPVSLEEWLPYAQGLKAALKAHSVNADPSRTADAASVLRPPGATWRKEDPFRIVQCGPIPEPFTLDELSVFLEFNRPEPTKYTPPAAPKSRLAAKVSLFRSVKQTTNFEKLVSSCRQIRALKDTPGQCSEPEWFAGIGVLVHCVGGREEVHKWSDWHEEVDKKFDASEKLTGPVACAHFNSLNDRCQGCAFFGKINSPLDIPTGEEPELPPAPPEIVAEAPSQKWIERKLSPFGYSDGKLVLQQEQGAGKDDSRLICGQYIYLEAIETSELKGGGHFYRFQHRLPHEGWRAIELTAGQARSLNVASVMADKGVNIHDGELFRRFVALSVDHVHKETRMETQYDQYGWKGKDFLYGSTLYTASGFRTVATAAELTFRNKMLRTASGGSADAWREAVNVLFGKGSEGQSLAITASFAAPLVRLLHDSEGGIILSMVTRDSGTGKTTSLTGASTVFASDRRGLGVASIDTQNSIDAGMATVCNLPIFHDEFKGDPLEINSRVSTFSEGRGRGRLERDGVQRASVGTWATILITASNTSLQETVGGLNGSDAMAYRILEVPIISDQTLTAAEGDKLQKVLRANAGWPGHMFLNFLTTEGTLDWLTAELPVRQADIERRAGFGRAERYWSRLLACCSCAGQLMAHLGIVDFSVDRIVDWTIEHLTQTRRPAQRDMKSYLSEFINVHVGEMLIVPTAWNADKRKRIGVGSNVPLRIPVKLTMRREEDTGTLYIDYNALRLWLIKKDVSMFLFQKELMGEGIIRGVLQRTLSAGTNLAGGQIKCFDIDGDHPAFTGMVREVSDKYAARA